MYRQEDERKDARTLALLGHGGGGWGVAWHPAVQGSRSNALSHMRVQGTFLAEQATGQFAMPQGNLQTLRLDGSAQGFTLKDDPLKGRVTWQIKRAETK